MRNKWKEVSDSDDSDLIDEPSPVPVVENTHLDKSLAEKNSCVSTKQTDSIGNEAVSSESSSHHLNSSKNSVDKTIKRKQKPPLEFNVMEKSKSLENDKMNMKATFDAEDLSSDDEIYIFHCPDNFKKHDLLNKIIDVSKPKQFVHGKDGEKYQLKIFNSENKQMTLAVPKNSSGGKLLNFSFKGHMVLQNIVEMKSNPISYLSGTEDSVVFPGDIKLRHPFLGVNWQFYIDSAREAIEKNHLIKKMRKKIKKEKTKDIKDVEIKKLKRKNSCEITSPKKHKKKHDSFNS